MKVVLFALLVVLLAYGANARAFNNYVREDTYGKVKLMTVSEDPVVRNETWVDFYYGFILGWQTQQRVSGQCYADSANFYKTINDTFAMLMNAYLPSFWFNLLDRIRINIDAYSKSLQSCQLHAILNKLQRMFSADGLIETMARLLTQIAFLKGYMDNFTNFLAAGNMTDAGVQLGKLTSAIIGVTVN